MPYIYTPPRLVKLVVAANGFLYADGVKIARLVREHGTLQFVDRNRQSAEARGSKYVEVAIAEVVKLAAPE